MFYLLAVYRCDMFYLLTVYRCGMLIPLFFCCSHPSVYLFFKKKFKSISASFSGKPKWIKSWSQCKFVFIFVKWFVRETPGVISLGAWKPLYPPLYLGVGKLGKWEVGRGWQWPFEVSLLLHSFPSHREVESVYNGVGTTPWQHVCNRELIGGLVTRLLRNSPPGPTHAYCIMRRINWAHPLYVYCVYVVFSCTNF